MNYQKDCKRCLNLTYEEHWTLKGGRCIAAYCLLYDTLVKFVKGCKGKRVKSIDTND